MSTSTEPLNNSFINPDPTSISESISAPNPQWKLAEKNGHTEADDEDDEIVEDDEEEEIDQLASASEPDDEEDPASASAAGTSTGTGPRRYRRTPGTTCLPATKIENILQADGVTGSLSLSKEGLYVLSVATEEFIKRLVQGGHRQASAARRNAMNYRDMADTTRQYQEFMFLKEIIPYPISLADAFELREALAKDSTFADTPQAPPSGSVSAPARNSSASSSKSKSRQQSMVNGQEKTNGNTSSSLTPRATVRDGVVTHGSFRWHVQRVRPPASSSVIDARQWTHWTEPITPTARAPHAESSANAQKREEGMSPIPTNPNANGTPSELPPSSSSSSAAPQTETFGAAAYTTGPASGFLTSAQGPQQNLGRTIYTQETPPV
ncbi:hypothetical protein GYMLUDRAFT_151179 [Collybiopsis luxurians FD-317 M1]|nr:hypothetical protein GYMLUDRAFT_151179 [Collybiopsis luxurians FD-317 M1]